MLEKDVVIHDIMIVPTLSSADCFFILFDFDQMKTFSFLNFFSKFLLIFWKDQNQSTFFHFSMDRFILQPAVSLTDLAIPGSLQLVTSRCPAQEPRGCPGPWLVYSEAWALLDTFTQAKHITLFFRLFLLAGDDIYSEIIFCLIQIFCKAVQLSCIGNLICYNYFDIPIVKLLFLISEVIIQFSLCLSLWCLTL